MDAKHAVAVKQGGPAGFLERPEQWPRFKKLFLAYADTKHAKVWYLGTQGPEPAGNATKERKRRYEDGRAEANFLLLQHTSDDMSREMFAIAEKNAANPEDPTARELWTALQQHCCKRDNSAISSLKTELEELVFDPSEPIETFFGRVGDVIDRCKATEDPSIAHTDRTAADRLLLAVRKSKIPTWCDAVDQMEMSERADNPLTLAEVKRKLATKHKNTMSLQQDSEPQNRVKKQATVLLSQNKTYDDDDDDGDDDYAAAKVRALEAKVRRLEQTLRDGHGTTRRDNRTCFNCHKDGHFVQQCEEKCTNHNKPVDHLPRDCFKHKAKNKSAGRQYTRVERRTNGLNIARKNTASLELAASHMRDTVSVRKAVTFLGSESRKRNCNSMANSSSDEAICDSGATEHMSATLDLLSDDTELPQKGPGAIQVQTAGTNESLPCKHTGTACINEDLTLPNVIHVEGLAAPMLVSISRLDRAGFTTTIKDQRMVIVNPDGKTVAVAPLKDGLYKCKIDNLTSKTKRTGRFAGCAVVAPPVAIEPKRSIHKSHTGGVTPTTPINGHAEVTSGQDSDVDNSLSDAETVRTREEDRSAKEQVSDTTEPPPSVANDPPKVDNVEVATDDKDEPLTTVLHDGTTQKLINKLHERGGHQSFKKTKLRIAKSHPTSYHKLKKALRQRPDPCHDCNVTKIHRASFPANTTRKKAMQLLERLYLDIKGPADVASRSGAWYTLLILDELSHKVFPLFLNAKSELSSCVKLFIKNVERQKELKVKILHMDGAGENTSADLLTYLKEQGIDIELTVARTPEQNSMVERVIQTIFSYANATHRRMGMGKEFWTYPVKQACRVYNTTPHPWHNNEKSPDEVWYGEPPVIHNEITLGAPVVVKDDKATGSNDDKGIPGKYLGEADNRRAGIIYLPDTDSIIETVHYTADETFVAPVHVDRLTQRKERTFDGELPLRQWKPLEAIWEHGNPLPSSTAARPGWLKPGALPPTLPTIPEHPAAPMQQQSQQPLQPPLPNGSFALDPATAPTQQEFDPVANAGERTTVHDTGENGVVNAAGENSEDNSANKNVNNTVRRSSRLKVLQESERAITSLIAKAQRNGTHEDEVHTTIAMLAQEAINEIHAANDRAPKNEHELDEWERWANKHNDDRLRAKVVRWRQAEKKETDGLVAQGTGTTAELPKGERELKTEMLYKIKEDGTYKCRYVCKGYAQRKWIDYSPDEIFSGVIKYPSLRLLIAIACITGRLLGSIDFKQAFLNGDLEEDIWIRPPKGSSAHKAGKSWKLNKTLYGLKQSPKKWDDKLSAALVSIGFTQCMEDDHVYVLWENNEAVMHFGVYVDDCPYVAKDDDVRDRVLAHLAKMEFEFTRQDELLTILNMEVQRDWDNKKITLTQSGYMKKVVETFGMTHCKPANIPMKPNLKLPKELEAATVEDQAYMKDKPYRGVVGSGMHAVTGTRPDLANPMRMLSRHLNDPRPQHWEAAQDALRYMSSTIDEGLLMDCKEARYEQQQNGRIKLLGDAIQVYADASYNDNEKSKSSSGYIALVCGATINWKSRTHQIADTSSASSETKGMYYATQEAVWLKNVLSEWGFELERPPLIHEDNMAAIEYNKNARYHGKLRHLGPPYHYTRAMLKQGEIRVRHCPTTEMAADILTKPLPYAQHRKLKQLCGMRGSDDDDDVVATERTVLHSKQRRQHRGGVLR